MTKEENVKNLLTELIDMIDNGSQRDLDRADEISKSILNAIEQEPILDKIKAEIVDTLYVDSLIFGELIDFKEGKISADDVIEEFNRVTRLEVLKIIDKYKTESEG